MRLENTHAVVKIPHGAGLSGGVYTGKALYIISKVALRINARLDYLT